MSELQRAYLMRERDRLEQGALRYLTVIDKPSPSTKLKEFMKGINAIRGTPTQSTSTSTTEEGAPKTLIPISHIKLQYNMQHSIMGHALIFNHETFQMDRLPERKGTHADAERLDEVLLALGFSVLVYNDLKFDDIQMRINQLASLDHSDSNCMLVVVLTHGDDNNQVHAYDRIYPIEELCTPFSPDRCPSLAGKPKLFFIQACRGRNSNEEVELKEETQTESVTGPKTLTIPLIADCFIAFSTVQGFAPWCSSEKGTWFIQVLCEVLEEDGFLQDLQTLLWIVQYNMAHQYENRDDKKSEDKQKQLPQTISTLTRKLFFNDRLL